MSLSPKNPKKDTRTQKERNVELFSSIYVDNTVKDTLARQFELMDNTWANISSCVPHVTKKEFKSIRRGSRIMLNRQGLGVLTDESLKHILEKNGIEVRE